jgi:hypothetical protein
LRAVVFNRTHHELAAGRRRVEPEEVRTLVRRLLGDTSAAAAVAENFQRYEMLGRGDGLRIEAFRRSLPKGVSVVEVPNFTSDVHSVADLRTMHPFLFAA